MLILVTGGSGSGKSAWAETKAVSLSENRIYLATMLCLDEESRRRVERHKAARLGKGFETIECPMRLENLDLKKRAGVILLECLTNLLANEMWPPEEAQRDKHQEEAAERNAYADRPGEEPDMAVDQQLCARVLEGIAHLRSQCNHLVVVTGEVSSDGKLYDPETERYKRILAALGRDIAQMADEVAEVVCGKAVVYEKPA